MKVLEKITLQTLKKNKRRTLVTVLGVMLSAALILAVVGMVTSFQKMMVNYAIAENGDFHDMFEEVPTEKLTFIEQNKHVEKYYYSAPLTEKDLDQSELEFYQRNPAVPYGVKDYQKLDSLPAKPDQKYNIFVRYTEPGDYEALREQILEAVQGSATSDTPINVRTNGELLRYEAGVMSDIALTAIYQIAAIVIFIIVITSIFAIRNSFSISATERAKQFGMLASIGATSKQIRQSVYYEGLIIGLIGIPLGLLLGTLAVFVLVIIVNLLLQDMMTASVEFSMPFWIFPITILLSAVTIFCSSLMPAIRAGRLAPIEAIRGNNDIKIKPRKLKTSPLVRQCFGIGGVIASKNLKRSRKKYRTTVISIVVSVATFVGLSSFLGYGEKTVGIQFSDEEIDYAIVNDTPEFYREVIERFKIQDYVIYEQTRAANASVYVMDAQSFARYAASLGLKSTDYHETAIMIDQAMNLNEDGSYSIDNSHHQLKDGDNYEVEVIKSSKQTDQSSDEANLEKHSLKITKVTDQKPLGFSRTYAPMIFVSEDYAHKDMLGVDNQFAQVFFQHLDGQAPEITAYLAEKRQEKAHQEMYYEDVEEVFAQSRRLVLLFGLFLYGFIAVVTLIGVTNIFNTITTNIALRAKEFAMLKSVGMTKREFNHMIRLESLMYIVKALLIGLPLGLLLSYGFYSSFSSAVDFGFEIPWMAIMISILAVAILIGLTMRYSVKQVSRQNLIETIRTENI